MNICLVYCGYPPTVGGGSHRAYPFAKYFNREGHTVHVVTKRIKGVHLVNPADFPPLPKTYIHRSPGFHIPKLPADSGYIPSFLHSTLKIIKKYNIDVFQSSSPQIAMGMVGYLAKKISKTPFVFEMRDPWVHAASTDSSSFDGAHYREDRWPGTMYKKLETAICSSADKIIVTNPGIREELLRVHKNLTKKDIEVIYNAADLDHFKHVKPHKFTKFTMFYAGSLYKHRMINTLIAACEQIPDATLLIAGTGDLKYIESIKQEVIQKGLSDRVKFLGLITPSEVYAHAAGADVCIATIRPLPEMEFLIPAKIYNYFAAETPLLCIGAKGGDFDRLIKETGAGIMVYEENVEKIVAAIEQLRKPNIAKKHATAGRKAAEKTYNHKLQSHKLLHIYKSIV